MFQFILDGILNSWFLKIIIGLNVLIFIMRRKFNRKIENEENLLLTKLNELKNADSPTQAISQFNNWIEENKNYISEEFYNSWSDFHNNYIKNTKKGNLTIPDVYDYFQEENLVQIRGKRQLIDLIPGFFLALGILGTFGGLVTATAHIDANGDSETLRQGVTTLIGGMSTAFLCSIAGIISSLGWQLYDRYRNYPRLLKNFHLLRSKLDEVFPTNDESSLLEKMLENQKRHLEDFQTYMSDNLIPQIALEMSKALENIFVPHLQQSQSMMEAVVKQTNENQVAGMKEMVDNFVYTLNQVAGDQMKNLESALRQTVEWQEKVHNEMSQLVEKLEQSAEKQSAMVDKTTKLTEEIHQYTNRLSEYQSVLENTIAELNDTTHKNKELQMAISDLLEKMTEERKAFDAQMQHHSQLLQQNVSILNEHTTLQNNLYQEYRQLTEQWNIGLSQVRSLTDVNSQLIEEAQEQNRLFSQINSQLQSLLGEINEHMKANQDLFSNLLQVQQFVSDEREQISQMQNRINEMLKEQLVQMDQRSSSLQKHWAETHQLFKEVNEQLSQSMEQFVEHMYRGLEHTFKQFDEELTKSVQTLAGGVNTLEQLITELPEHIDQFNHKIGELNQKLGHFIEEANFSLTKAINELNKNTERLMKQSSM